MNVPTSILNINVGRFGVGIASDFRPYQRWKWPQFWHQTIIAPNGKYTYQYITVKTYYDILMK